jgi:hypothetical protein
VKRNDLIRHLQAFGCHLLKEGRKHSRFVNLAEPSKQATVPRHREIDDYLARASVVSLAFRPPGNVASKLRAD